MHPALPLFVLVIAATAAVLIWWLVSAAFLLWGARLAGVQQRSFGRAMATILLGGLATLVVEALLNTAPVLGTGLGLLLGFVVSAAVMMGIFKTTFGQALAANILAWVLPFLLGFALFLLGLAVAGVLIALLA